MTAAYTLLVGDCIASMRDMPDASIHCCVTSPPYFGLRSYFEDGLRIDPTLTAEKMAWLLSELDRRGIRARG